MLFVSNHEKDYSRKVKKERKKEPSKQEFLLFGPAIWHPGWPPEKKHHNNKDISYIQYIVILQYCIEVRVMLLYDSVLIKTEIEKKTKNCNKKNQLTGGKHVIQM